MMRAGYLVGLLLSLCGCATQIEQIAGNSSIADPVSVPDDDHTRHWYFSRYKIHWPEGEEPAWHIDTMLADVIIKPVLNRYENDIPVWRLHRRAARTRAGHQFSFIFFTSRSAAEKILMEFDQHPVIDRLLERNILDRAFTSDIDKPYKHDFEDASWPKWSDEMRQAWPYFIMGTSATWLDLVEQYAAEENIDTTDLDSLLQAYKRINDRISELWWSEGGHAFLHHLNAIFGYQPLVTNQKSRF